MLFRSLRTNTPNQPFTVTGTVTMSWSTSINPTQSTLNATIGYGVASVCGVPPVTTVNSGTLTCQSSGSATTLTATSSGGTTFRWTGPANFTANTASITATSPGTYTVVSTNAQTGCSSTTTATVVQDPGVVVNLFSQSNCLNNGTDATTTDDFFTVSIQATTNTPGPAGRYEVVLGADANGLGGTVLNPGAPGGTPYGSTVTVGGAGQPNANGFLANGTSIYSLTIRDSANNNGNAGCRTTRLTGQVLPCSSCLPDPCQPVQLRKQ